MPRWMPSSRIVGLKVESERDGWQAGLNRGQGVARHRRRRTGHRFSIPRRSDRAAAARQTDQSASTQAHARTKTQTRQAKAWCHVSVNFANRPSKPML